jgi:hypothetical protein
MEMLKKETVFQIDLDNNDWKDREDNTFPVLVSGSSPEGGVFGRLPMMGDNFCYCFS